MRLLVCAAAPQRSQHRAEITAELGELLRRGWTADQLETAINDPERDRAEWPRLFRDRLRTQKAALDRVRQKKRGEMDSQRAQWQEWEQTAKKDKPKIGFAEAARLRAAGVDLSKLFQCVEMAPEQN